MKTCAERLVLVIPYNELLFYILVAEDPPKPSYLVTEDTKLVG